MTDLQDRLMQCLVRIVEEGGARRGTGFFAAPRMVMTCAHVVEPAAGAAPVSEPPIATSDQAMAAVGEP